MESIVKDELEELKEKLKNGKMETDKPNNFVEVYDYEGQYSHDEIYDFQSEFKDRAEVYLREKYKGKYAIMWTCQCVCIVTVDLLKEKNLKWWTLC